MTKKQKQIIAAWDMFEDLEPDISTERLYAMVDSYTGFDTDEITEALYAEHLEEESEASE